MLRNVIFIFLLLTLCNCSLLHLEYDEDKVPEKSTLLKIDHLQDIKSKIQNGDSLYSAIKNRLVTKADSMLTTQEMSVIYQPNIVEESSIHDYNSLSPYYWPNPNTSNGLPYIKKDGQSNPEAKKYDSIALSNFYNHIKVLTLAGYFTGNSIYYNRAKKLLHHWFLNGETYMAANFDYSQTKPGINKGSSSGLIQARTLAYITDYIILIAEDSDMDRNMQDALVKWYKAFNIWLENDQLGKGFARRINNLGTYHDVIYSNINQFVNNNSAVLQLLQTTTKQRIRQQLEPNGYQINEQHRTTSFSYSIFNLDAWTMLATIADSKGVNLWTVNKENESSILDAAKLLLSKIENPEKWKGSQIRSVNPCQLYPSILRISKNKLESSFRENVDSFLYKYRNECASIDYLTLPPITRK